MKINKFIFLFILGLILDFSPLFFLDEGGWWSWKMSTMLITTGYCIFIYIMFHIWQALETKIGPNSIIRFLILVYIFSKIAQIGKQISGCMYRVVMIGFKTEGLTPIEQGYGNFSEHLTAIEVVCLGLSVLLALAATIKTKSGNMSIYSNISPRGDQSEIGFSFKNKKD